MGSVRRARAIPWAFWWRSARRPKSRRSLQAGGDLRRAPGPPNLGLSQQFRQRPQSSRQHASHLPHATVRFRFFCAHQCAVGTFCTVVCVGDRMPGASPAAPMRTASGVRSAVIEKRGWTAGKLDLPAVVVRGTNEPKAGDRPRLSLPPELVAIFTKEYRILFAFCGGRAWEGRRRRSSAGLGTGWAPRSRRTSRAPPLAQGLGAREDMNAAQKGSLSVHTSAVAPSFGG